MVKQFDINIEKAIAITKYRIKHMEKHGMGKNTMREKEILQKQMRQKELHGKK